MLRFNALRRCIGIVAVASAACGCSPDMKLEDLQSSATGALQSIPAAAESLVPDAIKQPVGSATSVYTRVARGALTCWMGGHGSLKETHLFQADARPKSEGGAAEIGIHERIKNKPNQPGRKVFSITITPVGEGASVTSENLGLPEKQGDAMRADVDRWAAAEEGCLEEPITEGWATPVAETKGATSRSGKSDSKLTAGNKK